MVCGCVRFAGPKFLRLVLFMGLPTRSQVGEEFCSVMRLRMFLHTPKPSCGPGLGPRVSRRTHGAKNDSGSV